MTDPQSYQSSKQPVALERFVVRSPFRAKHHVVMQYMAAGPKCPLAPPPPPRQTPPPARPPLQKTAWLVEDKEDLEELINKEELMTLTPLQRCKGLCTTVALSTASCYACFRVVKMRFARIRHTAFSGQNHSMTNQIIFKYV